MSKFSHSQLPASYGVHRDLVLSQRSALLRFKWGHREFRGASACLIKIPRARTWGREGTEEAGGRVPPSPSLSWLGAVRPQGPQGNPQILGRAPLTGFGKTERKRKEGVVVEEKKAGSFCVAKNWPQTLSTGTLEQIFLGHTHLPATTCHTTKLTAHTFPFCFSALPALA